MARWEDGPNVPRKLTWNPLATGATCSLYLGWTWLAGCLKISSGNRADVGPCFTTSSVFPAEIMVTIIYEGREKKEKGIARSPISAKVITFRYICVFKCRKFLGGLINQTQSYVFTPSPTMSIMVMAPPRFSTYPPQSVIGFTDLSNEWPITKE